MLVEMFGGPCDGMMMEHHLPLPRYVLTPELPIETINKTIAENPDAEIGIAIYRADANHPSGKPVYTFQGIRT